MALEPCLLEREPPFVLVVEVFLFCQMVSVIFIRKSIPSVDKLLHLDDVQSFEFGIHDLVGIGHEFLGTVSFLYFFFNWLAR